MLRARRLFRNLLQAFSQSVVLCAQCIQELAAAPTRGQVASEALRLRRFQFAVHEDRNDLFRITFHDHLLPWPSFRRNSCLARNNSAAT
jgi:hypothetical protein